MLDGAGLCGRRQRNLLDGGGGGGGVAVRFDEGVGQLGAPRPRPVREGGEGGRQDAGIESSAASRYIATAAPPTE